MAELEADDSPVFTPLTPALSPLRGEGDGSRVSGKIRARRAWTPPKRARDARTRRGACKDPQAHLATPSPLNGERAGVRGVSTNCPGKLVETAAFGSRISVFAGLCSFKTSHDRA
jgi:hypothetical protein